MAQYKCIKDFTIPPQNCQPNSNCNMGIHLIKNQIYELEDGVNDKYLQYVKDRYHIYQIPKEYVEQITASGSAIHPVEVSMYKILRDTDLLKAWSGGDAITPAGKILKGELIKGVKGTHTTSWNKFPIISITEGRYKGYFVLESETEKITDNSSRSPNTDLPNNKSVSKMSKSDRNVLIGAVVIVGILVVLKIAKVF